jgi:hypothetical protein
MVSAQASGPAHIRLCVKRQLRELVSLGCPALPCQNCGTGTGGKGGGAGRWGMVVWQIGGHLLLVLPTAESGADMKKCVYPIDGYYHR